MLVLMVATAVLSGCATREPATTLAVDQGDIPFRYLASAADEDPIGRLLAQQGLTPGAGMRVGPRQNLVSEAMNHLGVRYAYGGNSPDKGFDCSGLVSFVARQSLGLRLPRSAAEIAAISQQVESRELVAGDLVFFNTMGRKYSHVGIYVGGNKFVHSPSAGGVVRVDDMQMAYWAKRYNGARRLEGPALLAMQQQ